MSAQELRTEVLGLLADVRSAGRRGSRTSFQAVVDRRLPSLFASHDPFEGARLTDGAMAAIMNAVSAACERHSTEPERSGTRFTLPAPWRWSLAGAAALVLILLAIYSFRAPKQSAIAKRGPTGISGPNQRIVTPDPRRRESIVEKRQEPEIQVIPAPRRLERPRERVVERPIPPRNDEPPNRVVARVEVGLFGRVTGAPQVWQPGAQSPVQVKEKMPVLLGARIETGDMDKVELLQNDGSTLALGFNATLELPSRGGPGFIAGRDFLLSSGTIFAHVAPMRNLQRFAIHTPAATAEALGTEFNLGIEKVAGAKRDPKGAEVIRAVLQVKSGRVKFYNEAGDVLATDMEESTAVAGERPTDPQRVPTLKTYLFSSGDSNWYTSDSTWKLDEQRALNRLVFDTNWTGIAAASRSDGKVRVLEVFHDSPASNSGLKVGDVLLAIDGQPVRSAETLRRQAIQGPEGKLAFEVNRRGQTFVVAVESIRKSQSRPPPWSTLARRLRAATSPALLGARAESLANLRRIAETAPNAAVFNNLGIVQELGDEMGPAIRSYQAALRLEPGVALYHYNLGLALQGIGNSARAVEELETAIALEPGFHDGTISLARAYYIADRVDDAVRLLDSASAASPNCSHFSIVKGMALSRGKRHDEAVAALEHALRIDPDNLWAHNVLASALKYKGSFVEVEKVFRNVLELDPGNVSTIVDLGSLLAEMRRFSEAETMLRSALAIEPDSSGAHFKLGLMLGRDLRRFAEAEKELREAIRLGERSAPVYLNLGAVLRALGKPDEAELAYRKAIEVDPGFVLAYSNLGTLYYFSNRFAEAAKMYRRAIELAPTDARFHLNLGFALNRQNRSQEAETSFRAAIQSNPRSFEAHYELGKLLMNQSREPEAEPILRKATELNANHGESHVDLGVVLLRLRRYPDAEIVLRRAIALQPNNPNAHANLGAVLEGAGRNAEAESMYRRAAELEPTNADWPIALGHLLDSMERYTDSVSAFQSAITADPKRASSYVDLGWSLIKTHQWEEAVSAYRRCIEIDPKGPNALNAMNCLANALLNTGDLEGAYQLSEQTLMINPKDPKSQSTRAHILASKGIRLDEALHLAKKGAQALIVPSQRWYVLGFVHFKRGESDQAIEPLKKAAEGYGKSCLAADAFITLGAVYEAKKDSESALDAYRNALKIEPANRPAAAAIKRLAP